MRFPSDQKITSALALACSSLVLAMLFVALLFVSVGNHQTTVRASALMPEQQSRAADMAGIDELHRKDVAATLARDPKLLEELWTQDAVRLEPGSPAEVGLSIIHANDAKEIAAHPGARVLSYQPDIKDVQIVGDCAYEWDNFVASFQESADAKVETFHAKGLRVLRRQPDGSWKFARVSWNLNE